MSTNINTDGVGRQHDLNGDSTPVDLLKKIVNDLNENDNQRLVKGKKI